MSPHWTRQITDSRPNLVLCARHAREVVHDLTPPTGECDPHGSWTGGRGDAVWCEARDEARIAAYLKLRRQENPSEVAGD